MVWRNQGFGLGQQVRETMPKRLNKIKMSEVESSLRLVKLSQNENYNMTKEVIFLKIHITLGLPPSNFSANSVLL